MSLKIVDVPMIARQLINDNYTLSKVHNSTKPIIKVIYDLKKLNPTLAGIYVYQISDNILYNYSARLRHDRDIVVSLDFRFKSRKYLLSNLAHIREILEQNITNIANMTMTDTDYTNTANRIYELRGRDMSNRQKNFHRYVLDVKLENLGHVRAT